MSRKNKNFRAWQHLNPDGTPKEAWDAAWKSQGQRAYSLRIQDLLAAIKMVREDTEIMINLLDVGNIEGTLSMLRNLRGELNG